jgi:phage major head subunit gpT-like protein
MANPLVSSQFARLLDDRLRKVQVDAFKELPSYIDQFYGVIKSDKAWEEFYGVGAVPDVPVFSGTLEYLGVAPDYYTRIEPKEYAAGITIERKLIDDDRYDVIKGRQAGLAQSLVRVREKYGAQGFAYAFSSAFTFMNNEEAVSLCSTAHLTKSGASTTSGFSNSGTTALSKTAIAATRILMRQFRSDVGARVVIDPDMIIVPDTQWDAACEAVGYSSATGASSDRDPDSAMYGKINAQYKRFTVVPYLRLDDYSTKSWFMVDSKRMKEFMLWVERMGPETSTIKDFETFMYKQSIYARFGYGWLNWRWIYGMNVS